MSFVGMNQFDAAVQRNFSLAKLYEPMSLQFRVDMINALNHPVYGRSGDSGGLPRRCGCRNSYKSSFVRIEI